MRCPPPARVEVMRKGGIAKILLRTSSPGALALITEVREGGTAESHVALRIRARLASTLALGWASGAGLG